MCKGLRYSSHPCTTPLLGRIVKVVAPSHPLNGEVMRVEAMSSTGNLVVWNGAKTRNSTLNSSQVVRLKETTNASS